METVGAETTIWSLVAQADIVVKIVMFILAASSVWSWAIAVDKWLSFTDVKSRAREFEREFWSGRSIESIDSRGSERPGGAMARVFAAGASEWRQADIGTASALNLAQERVDRMTQAAIQREVLRMGAGLPVLATIGASAPFIGLFGTVWGIMNSFTAIAANQQTNLAVVAPGIAEALFATALGLFAAIPAVIFYNKFSTDADRFADRLEALADEASARFARRFVER